MITKVKYINNKSVLVDTMSLVIKGGWSVPKTNYFIPNDIQSLQLCYDTLKNKKDPTMMDIGANVGVFSLLPTIIANLHCISFEPVNFVFEILKQNILNNNIQDKVQLFNLGISNTLAGGIIKVPLNKVLAGLATMGTPKRYTYWTPQSIDTTTIDHFMEYNILDKGILNLDLIKLDIEGGELFALRGGEHTIKTFKPIIICECQLKNTIQYDYNPNEIIQLLESWNYQCEFIDKNNMLCQPN